ncbi:MAG: DUF547 domain-containing protein, partial [Bacteroidota bacterium]
MGRIWFVWVFFLLLGCQTAQTSERLSTTSLQSPDHKSWDVLLKKWVSEEGWVDYKGFLTERDKLDVYLQELSNNSPDNSWGESEKLAYWIVIQDQFYRKSIVCIYPIG